MQTRILVADDNAEIREILRILLTGEGYEVIEAKDGNEVLQLFDSSIDLIVLDIMMPNMNGYQTCLKLRETSNVPILFLTAKGLGIRRLVFQVVPMTIWQSLFRIVN